MILVIFDKLVCLIKGLFTRISVCKKQSMLYELREEIAGAIDEAHYCREL